MIIADLLHKRGSEDFEFCCFVHTSDKEVVTKCDKMAEFGLKHPIQHSKTHKLLQKSGNVDKNEADNGYN